MSKLDLSVIETGRQAKPRRIMLYGVHGIGKSTWAASAPAPVFIPTEDGLSDIDCHSFPLCTEYPQIPRILRTLLKSDHKYHTVVIDSLDWLEKLIWSQVCVDESVDHIEEVGYAKGYKYAMNYWSDVLTYLTDLRMKKNMGIILLAHARIEAFADPESENYDRFTPDLHKHAAATVSEWVDEILFARYKIHTKKVGESFGQDEYKGIGTGERIIKTTERPGHVAKNRLGLPDELPLDWGEYAKFFTSKKESSDGKVTD